MNEVLAMCSDLPELALSARDVMLMDQVLGNLIAMRPAQCEPGSQREDVPDY